MGGGGDFGVVKKSWIELGKQIPKLMIDENVIEQIIMNTLAIIVR
jgi:hypothetical protein